MGEYGEIIDIVAKTNLKAKGQAFIVFDSVGSAQRAIDEVQSFELFDKPMQLAFAKTRSDASVKRTGGDDELETHKRRRLAEKGIASLLPCCRGEEANVLALQIRKRPPKQQSNKNSSNAPQRLVYLPKSPLDPSKQLAVLVSSLQVQEPQL